MKKTTIITILSLIIVAGTAFLGGMKYGQFKRLSFRQLPVGQNTGRQQGQGGQNRLGFRSVNGEIIASDDKSITVKLQDGSGKIVVISDKTSINKASEGVKEDLKIGEKVMVIGQENSDGTVTAQNIQLNPMMRGSNGQ